MRKPLPELSGSWNTHTNRWDWFFLSVLALLLIFLPFSLGVVEAWSELVVVGLASLLSCGLILRSWLDAEFRIARTYAHVPLLLVLALIFIQLLPLPVWLLQILSSTSVELRETFGSTSAQAPSGWKTLSLYPYETAHDLRMAYIFTAVFVTAASIFRSKDEIKRALWMVFGLGCIEASIALLQILTLTKRVHWMFAERGQVATAGSFINHSHFCQFLNLTLGAGVALLLVRMKEDSRRDRGEASRFVDLRGERYLRPLTGVVLCTVAVFTSMSRNGVLSLLIAAGIIAVLLYRRGVLSVRGWLLGAVPWLVAVVLFFTSFDTVYERFAKLDDGSALSGRLEMTASTLRAWRDFPLLGSGLGTHEYVFPLYDESAISQMAEHADNDWAQLLEEFGVVGGAAVLAFVLSIFWLAGKLMLTGRASLSTAAFGLSLGLLATAWHSLSDFGQHLPGVFVLTAMVSGLVVAVARYESRKTDGKTRASASKSSGGSPRFVGKLIVLVCALVIVCCGWSLYSAWAVYRGEAWARVAFGIESRLQENDWQATEQEFVDLLTAAQYAADAEPSNVKHAYLLNLYRWRSISQTRDPNTDDLLLSSESMPFVSQIADQLMQLRVICPMYGPIHGLEGELRWFVLGEAEGRELIEQAAQLTPYDAATCFVAGQLAASEGRWKEARRLLKRTIALEPRRFLAVARFLLVSANRSELALELAEEDYQKTSQLLKVLDDLKEARPEYLGLADDLRERSRTRLREIVESGQASAIQLHQLARVERRAGRLPAATELLRKALTLDYGQKGWRLSLARILIELGETDQALREAKIVQRLDPHSKQAAEIIDLIGDIEAKSVSE